MLYLQNIISRALSPARCPLNECRIANSSLRAAGTAPTAIVRNAKLAAAIQSMIIGAGNLVCQICRMALEFHPVILSLRYGRTGFTDE
jgi:hypothetical protein